jgi:hypothetical protein
MAYTFNLIQPAILFQIAVMFIFLQKVSSRNLKLALLSVFSDIIIPKGLVQQSSSSSAR